LVSFSVDSRCRLGVIETFLPAEEIAIIKLIFVYRGSSCLVYRRNFLFDGKNKEFLQGYQH
jgi:hypothetical protein